MSTAWIVQSELTNCCSMNWSWFWVLASAKRSSVPTSQTRPSTAASLMRWISACCSKVSPRRPSTAALLKPSER